MNRYEKLIERYGAVFTGTALVGLPAGGWFYRGTLSWMDVIVALIGIAAVASAVEDFMRRRHLARSLRARPGPRGRHTVCPRSGEPRVEGA